MGRAARPSLRRDVPAPRGPRTLDGGRRRRRARAEPDDLRAGEHAARLPQHRRGAAARRVGARVADARADLPRARPRLGLEQPEAVAALGLQLCELLAVDLAHAYPRDRVRRIDLLDHEARLVLVEMLAGEPRPVVVRPDERLPAGDVV